MSNNKIVQVIVAGGVIIHQKEILILKRSSREKVLPNYWEIPSGKKLPLENVEVCLAREVREETGLLIEPILPFSVFEYQVASNNEIQECTQINYLSLPKRKSRIALSEEHEDFDWIRKEDLHHYKMSKEVKKVINRAFELKKMLDSFKRRKIDPRG